jgi:hypothetical protein
MTVLENDMVDREPRQSPKTDAWSRGRHLWRTRNGLFVRLPLWSRSAS